MMNSSAFILACLLSAAAAAKYTGPTNQAGVNLIKEFEGFRSNFYSDPVGIRTIGYGHGCHAFPCSVPIYGLYSVPLTQASGEAILKRDLATFESCVKGAVTYTGLTANQFSALASFTFNLGCGNLKTSTLLKKLNAGDVTGASNEFPKWVYAGGQILPGLVRRRAAEQALFCTGSSCGGGGGGTTCKGSVNASGGLIVRASASTSAKQTGSLANGETVTITGRVTGTSVNGNSNWFKVSAGYASAYYINIVANNGATWCKK